MLVDHKIKQKTIKKTVNIEKIFNKHKNDDNIIEKLTKNKKFKLNNELFDAIRKGNLCLVKKTIEKGANVNLKNKAGQTPLMIASLYGYNKIVKILIENNANVNKKDNIGWTALMYASTRGHETIVKLLIEKKADFNIKDKKGYTTLMHASLYGYEKVVKLLHEFGIFE